MELAGRDVQLVETVRDVRVVVEKGGVLGVPVAHGPPERAGREQRPELDRRVEEVTALEPARTLRERRERKPVPGRDDLVVEPGLRPTGANGEQLGPRLLVEPAAQNRTSLLERLEQVGGRFLPFGPGVRQPLDTVRVGVLRRREAAARRRSSRST